MDEKENIKVTMNRLVSVLKDRAARISFLVSVATSKKEDSIREIQQRIENWLRNESIIKFREKLVDVAIIVYVNNMRMKRQDVDNIAKVILDSISQNKHTNPDAPFLLENDSQVIRLLVEKRKVGESCVKKEVADEVSLSIREYCPSKEMILEEVS